MASKASSVGWESLSWEAVLPSAELLPVWALFLAGVIVGQVGSAWRCRRAR